MSPCILLNKNSNFNKIENRKSHTRVQLLQELQIKSKTVMSWSSQKKKENIFDTVSFLKFAFYLNAWCIRIHTLLHTKKHYFINFWFLLLKSLKAFHVSLKMMFIVTIGDHND